METVRMPNYARIKRYTLVRFLSRGGDYAISNLIMWFYGETSFYWAIALAAGYNFSVDYVGNEFWAFSDKHPTKQRNRTSLVSYSFVRLGYGLFGFCVLFLLYKLFLLPYPISSLIAGIVMWLYSFKTFERLFTGSAGERM